MRYMDEVVQKNIELVQELKLLNRNLDIGRSRLTRISQILIQKDIVLSSGVVPIRISKIHIMIQIEMQLSTVTNTDMDIKKMDEEVYNK